LSVKEGRKEGRMKMMMMMIIIIIINHPQQ
jgi:hypothetical protein